MPNVDLSYEDIELICARLSRPGVDIDERSQAIMQRLRAAQGLKSNPENPGDPAKAAKKWRGADAEPIAASPRD